MKIIENGVLRDMTTEEVNAFNTQKEIDIANETARKEAIETAKQAQADLKASAKAKLMSGEALTEEEANTIVL